MPGLSLQLNLTSALIREPLRIDQKPSGCWVACIAGLTHLPHDELYAFCPPNLRELMNARTAAIAEKPDDWWNDERVRTCDDAWCAYQNGVNLYLRSNGWRLAYLGEDVPAGFAMAYGAAARGFDHAVIVLAGKLWHDPHASREGLLDTKPITYETVVPLVDSPAMRAA